MKMVNLADAKARLAELVERAEKGERIVIARRNQPIAELRAVSKPRKTKRPYGLCKGQFVVPAGFDDPLPATLQRAFEGGGD